MVVICTVRSAIIVLGLTIIIQAATGPMDFTPLFSDTFDTGVSSTQWPYVPGKINAYRMYTLVGSFNYGNKDHTGNGGQAATEVPANPFAYASYHEFTAPRMAVLRLSAWIWQDAERPLCTQETWPVRGMVGLTSAPGPMLSLPPGPTGPNQVYPYDDYAFIGMEMAVSNDPADPVQKFYRWRTKTDDWNLTAIPRKVDYVCHGAQTWRHVEIVIYPYTGNAGDIQFFVDGDLVAQGHRAPGTNQWGVPFQRIQIGSRFPEESDALDVRPPYSYEFFWFDDVELSTASPCRKPRFDFDGDTDVDQVDFGVFQACYTGPGDPNQAYNLPECGCFDANADLDIDIEDFTAFTACFSGAAIPASVACDEGLPIP